MLQNGHKHGVKLEVVKLPEGSLHSSSQVSEIVGPLRVKPVQTRAIQTVEHILRTAALLLADVGVDQFNTNLLAERADVRVRTVYRYFVDKHAVILCLAERMYQRADESFTRTLRVLADPRVEWRLAIDGAIEDYFLTMGANPEWVAIRRAVQSVPGLDSLRARSVARHAEWLADALCARGLSLPKSQVRIIAAVTFAGASGAIEPAVRANPRQRKVVVRELKSMVHAYLSGYLD